MGTDLATSLEFWVAIAPGRDVQLDDVLTVSRELPDGQVGGFTSGVLRNPLDTRAVIFNVQGEDLLFLDTPTTTSPGTSTCATAVPSA